MMAASLTRCSVPGCGKYATCKHHIFTRGAYRSRALVPENEFDTCNDHHNMDGDSWHVAGRDTFAEDHGLEDVVERARRAVQG